MPILPEAFQESLRDRSPSKEGAPHLQVVLPQLEDVHKLRGTRLLFHLQHLQRRHCGKGRKKRLNYKLGTETK